MKKSLLCALTCASLLLVACSGKKSTDSDSDSKSYSDYVKLGTYKGMQLTEESAEVTDQDLQDKIDEIISENTSVEQIKTGKVKDGDTVNIDFVGKKDGVAFDGGTASGQSLTIGSNTYIDGFEEGLIGAKVGDEVTLNLTFPEDYGNDELNGQDVVFEVTVNYIEGETVTPEWNDNFVAGISDYDTAKEYEQELKEELEEDAEENVEYDIENQILTNLVSVSTYSSLPEDEVDSYADSMIQYYQDYATQNNMEYTDLLTNTFGMTEDQFNEQVQSTAENAIKQKVAVYAIAEKENLTPTGQDLEDQELAIVQKYSYDTVEDFEDAYGDGYAEQLVIRQAVLDFIKDNATITPASSASATASPDAAVTASPDADTAQ